MNNIIIAGTFSAIEATNTTVVEPIEDIKIDEFE
jgi:hypothetical protein